MQQKHSNIGFKVLELDLSGTHPKLHDNDHVMFEVPTLAYDGPMLAAPLENFAREHDMSESEWIALDNAVRELVDREFMMKFIKSRLR